MRCGEKAILWRYLPLELVEIYENLSPVSNLMNEKQLVGISDVFSSPKKIFKNTKGECKRADFVIIAKGEKGSWIIYIEMKRSNYGSEAVGWRFTMEDARIKLKSLYPPVQN